MPEANTVDKGMDEMRRSWTWFVSLGVALIILGLISFIYGLTATVTTVSLFGWLLLIGGTFELVPSVRKGTWRGFPFYLLDTMFRMVVGLLCVSYPGMGLAPLQALLVSFLLIIGLFRAFGAGKAKFAHYGWAVSSGILTTLLGLMAIAWTSYSYAGFAIGADLIFGGVAMVGFGIGLHGTPRQTVYRPA